MTFHWVCELKLSAGSSIPLVAPCQLSGVVAQNVQEGRKLWWKTIMGIQIVYSDQPLNTKGFPKDHTFSKGGPSRCPNRFEVEYAKSSRSACKQCKEKIASRIQQNLGAAKWQPNFRNK